MNIPLPVDGGERAVIFDRFRGVLPHVVGEGTHFLVPWIQRPIIFSVRSKPRRIPVVTGSKGVCVCVFVLSGYCVCTLVLCKLVFAIFSTIYLPCNPPLSLSSILLRFAECGHYTTYSVQTRRVTVAMDVHKYRC